MVAADEAVGRSFVDAFEDTPVVLMAAAATHADVLRAVKMGAVDFLDKPLSLLKLKNIWQHSVRKVRRGGGEQLLGFCKGAEGRGLACGGTATQCRHACKAASHAPLLTASPLLPPRCPQMMLKAAGPRPDRSLSCGPAASAAPSAAATPTAPTAILPVVGPVPPSATALSSWTAGGASAPAPSASMGPESPGTPAGSVDLPETFSICSMEDTGGSVHGSVRCSFDAGTAAPAPSASDSLMEALNGGLPRATSCTSMPAPTGPLANGGPAPAVWPALPTGCVWGTPFNGPVSPPLPSAAAAPAPVPAPAPAPAPAAALAAAPAPAPATAPSPADWPAIVLPVRRCCCVCSSCCSACHGVQRSALLQLACIAACRAVARLPSYRSSCCRSWHTILPHRSPVLLLLPPPSSHPCISLLTAMHAPSLPLQEAPEVPTLIKGSGSSSVMQPVPASTDALVLPEGFLTAKSGEQLVASQGSFAAVSQCCSSMWG